MDISDTVTTSVARYVSPSISHLLKKKWVIKSLEYFSMPPTITILDIRKTPNIKLVDIIDQLAQYFKSQSEDTYAGKMYKLLRKINTKKLTNNDRHAIRKNIEITQEGKTHLQHFYNHLKAQGIIDPNLGLILNPFTSIINLAEIYAQCDTMITVDFATEGLGMVRDKLHIIYPSTKPEWSDLHTKTNKWLNDCLMRICYFNWLLKTNKLPNNIYIFLPNFRKEFMRIVDDEDMIFTSSEINTGVCDMKDIIISRSEEALKTILHELIHFHNLDFKHAIFDKECRLLFNINTHDKESFNLFEAHTECLASILHCISRSSSQSDFRKIFTRQIIYTLYKSAMILRKSGCHQYIDFIPESDNTSAKCTLHESTNVFSYFIAKTCLYFNLVLWLDKCCISDDIPGFNTTTHGFKTLLQIIELGKHNKLIQKTMDIFIKQKTTDKSLKMVWIP